MDGKRTCVALIFFGMGLFSPILAQPEDKRQRHYNRVIRPILRKHCFSCHNNEDRKAGISFENYGFIVQVVRDGERFHKVIESVQSGTMPPNIRPPMRQDEIDTLTFHINGYLQKALEEKDPGLIYPRRLNNQEYKYTLKDLLDVEVNVDSIFPSDPSGGLGFDNQARTLYLSPLLLERYFETADNVIEEVFSEKIAWRKLVPAYRSSTGNAIKTWWYRLWYKKDISLEAPRIAAEKVLFPFATKAYRKLLDPVDKERLVHFFQKVYTQSDGEINRFDMGIKECLKLILVSNHFLYRKEADPDMKGAYKIANIELASRLSFFLWSSIPDEHLLNVAYREDLHDPKVLEREVSRMLNDPKAKRLGEQFAVQWLDLKKLKDPAFQLDSEIYPSFTSSMRALMLKEVERFFNHALLEEHDLLDLLDSDYSFLNENLANHYGVKGIEGERFQMVRFASNERGGILGMAGVLTATSLPTRTSPVLRGKWVLEQVLGTPAPPPPPDVPELEASHDSTRGPQTLRQMLERHRADPACSGCHKAMDPIGLGLENFDAMGRWRNAYGDQKIDASGVLKSGEAFSGPSELREALLGKKKLFARNFSKHMLSYALGRSLAFKDTPTIDHLQNTLLESDFNSIQFIIELVNSYPFRFKKSDTQDVPS